MASSSQALFAPATAIVTPGDDFGASESGNQPDNASAPAAAPATDLPSFIVNQTNGLNDPVSDTADQVVKGNTARSTYGVDGTGIKVGIISDSFNLDGTASTDESDGALPPAGSVHIVKEGPSGSGDEGRAMAEIVHSIAPGAQIYFYTCGESDADMAQAITSLQQQGCQIIADNVTFFDEPFYEAGGTISQAVDQVVAQGSTYFTAAGNSAESFYEGAFNPILAGSVEAQDFGVAGSLKPWLEPITIPKGFTVDIDLQWNQPFLTALGAGNGTGSTNSLGFELYNSAGIEVDLGSANAIGSNPIQFGTYQNNTGNSSLYLAVFQNVASGPLPGEFKIIIDDNSFTPVTFKDPNGGVGSGTVIGHEVRSQCDHGRRGAGDQSDGDGAVLLGRARHDPVRFERQSARLAGFGRQGQSRRARRQYDLGGRYRPVLRNVGRDAGRGGGRRAGAAGQSGARSKRHRQHSR